METPQFNQVPIPQRNSWDHVCSSNWLGGGGQEAEEDQQEEDHQDRPSGGPIISSYSFVFPSN
jgi:hypothetical protein